MLLVLPLIIYDASRVSNRIVGPFARVQRAVRQLAHGDPVTAIRVRNRDLYWEDWIQDFNHMVTRLTARTRSATAVEPVCQGEGE